MGRPRVPPWNLDAEFATDLTRRRQLQPLLNLVGQFAVFLDPRVVRAIPLVYPMTARLTTGKLRQGEVLHGIRYWTNQPAEAAFFGALGAPSDRYSGLVVCHVYPGSPSSPAHFTNLANLFIVPTTLASFTEWEPVLAALQWRAYQLYGYGGPPGGKPKRPTVLPKRWQPPAKLPAASLEKVINHLREVRRDRPMYIQPRAGAVEELTSRSLLEAESLPWWQVALEEGTLARSKRSLASGAVDLESQFWLELYNNPALMRLLTSWVVRHAYFAPRAVVAAVPNPFPKTRRFHPSRGEMEGDVKDGITLCVNKPARAAMIVAVGHSIPRTRGALVDHLWADAAFLPEHFAHLGGLIIVPLALGTVVDAGPMRAVLQRRAFERTGYAGPGGVEPTRPREMPQPWPENLVMSPLRLARAIAKLERYRKEIPGFYRKWRPGGPGRRPRGRPRSTNAFAKR